MTADPLPNCTGGSRYVAYTSVSLSPHPASGKIFDRWSGDATGTANPLAVIMDTDKSIIANFQNSPNSSADAQQDSPYLPLPLARAAADSYGAAPAGVAGGAIVNEGAYVSWTVAGERHEARSNPVRNGDRRTFLPLVMRQVAVSPSVALLKPVDTLLGRGKR